MKIIIAPDSYKGTYSAAQIAHYMAEGCRRAVPDAEITELPLADGGEGTLEALGCRMIEDEVCGVFAGERVKCRRGELNGTAVIETAQCCGLPLAEGRADPSLTTTCGVGELIAHALDDRSGKIMLTLGGSATNDLGCGMAAALGTRFLDRDGKEFVPTGATLGDIADIDLSGLDPRLKNTKICAACDVTNVLYGENGAAYVFAPQKGADRRMVEMLDAGLRHCAEILERRTGICVSQIPGGGAAGGMGAAVAAFLGGRLLRGIECVLDVLRFDDLIADADLILTGEGMFDSQSLGGKAVSGVGMRAKKRNVPCIIIAGAIQRDIILTRESGITAAFSCQCIPEPFEEAVKHTEQNIIITVENLLEIMQKKQLN